MCLLVFASLLGDLVLVCVGTYAHVSSFGLVVLAVPALSLGVLGFVCFRILALGFGILGLVFLIMFTPLLGDLVLVGLTVPSPLLGDLVLVGLTVPTLGFGILVLAFRLCHAHIIPEILYYSDCIRYFDSVLK